MTSVPSLSPAATVRRRTTRSEASSVVVRGWGCALPRHRYAQRELAAHLAGSLSETAGRRLRAAFRGSGIETRCSVLGDFLPSESSTPSTDSAPLLFRNGSPPPSTSERMQVFARLAPPLAVSAARTALDDAGVPARDVTHLVFITCTGFAAPGPDRDLVLSLGLSPDVKRIQIGYQGCSAGIVGLRTASEIVRGDARALVLVVAVELSSLHFQPDPDDEQLRGHALFADGAGAALVGRRFVADAEPAGADPLPRVELLDGASRLIPSSEDHMTWDVGDTGFRMRLSARVPETLANGLPTFVDDLTQGRTREIVHWAIHPGGPVIVDRVRDGLHLNEESLVPSRDVLRTCGNMSSATIFFVMERIARAGHRGDGVALAFGPGLTVEGLRFRVLL